MRRRQLLAVVGAGLAAGAAGCLSRAQESNGGSGAGTTGGSNGGTTTLGVSGRGEVDSEPDIAELSVATIVDGEDGDAIRDELGARSDDVRAAVLDSGIDDDDLTTGTFRVGEYRRREEDGPSLRGVHEYEVTVRDVDAVGSVIDAAIDAGADEVGRIRFTLSDAARDELREEALGLAVEDARAEAEVIADAKDMRVVGVDSITTETVNVGTVRADPQPMMEADDTAETRIDQGDVTVGASVDVIYRIA